VRLKRLAWAVNLALATMRERQSTLSSFCARLAKRGPLVANPVAQMHRTRHRREARIAGHHADAGSRSRSTSRIGGLPTCRLLPALKRAWDPERARPD
jgi:hypothetical protein